MTMGDFIMSSNIRPRDLRNKCSNARQKGFRDIKVSSRIQLSIPCSSRTQTHTKTNLYMHVFVHSPLLFDLRNSLLDSSKPAAIKNGNAFKYKKLLCHNTVLTL